MSTDPRAALAAAQAALDRADPASALALTRPLTADLDIEIAGLAWLLTGTASYRLDDEDGALVGWQHAADSESAIAWLGWRSVAEQLVRNGSLQEAIHAYREADRRSPADERPAIASRIAWLLKETGHDSEARREFNRSRGPYASYVPVVTWVLIAINVVVFGIDWLLSGTGSIGLMGSGGPLVPQGAVSAAAVANGEWYRMITSAFLHLGPLHLFVNMYALFLFGPIIEQLYGHIEYAVIYLLCAVGGSVLTILVAPDQAAVGASGAIFGLLGLAFAVSRRRHLALSRQTRAMISQAGSLLVINLVITFVVPGISWTGHVGGLIVGALIGWLLPPASAFTLAAGWRNADGTDVRVSVPLAMRAAVYASVGVLLLFGTYFAVAQFG
jgi:membrane associated rhomboid family serine protease